MLCHDNYFPISVKLDLCQRQFHCIDDQDKVQYVTDSDNKLTECQTLMKKNQSIGISPVSLQAFMETLKSDISEAQKVQLDFYDKNDMKQKMNDLVRLHKAIQEKLKTASFLEQIQILTLVPDKWSRMYCSEYFKVFEYIV